MLYVLVTVTLTSLRDCNGQAVDTEVVQRPPLQGRLQFRSVVPDEKHEAVTPSRHGSLSFKSDTEGDQSTPGKKHIFSCLF